MNKAGTLVMVSVPASGRVHTRLRHVYPTISFAGWVEDKDHPLGGRHGNVLLYRRVNLKKDEIPRWIRDRPLYEFTKERPS